MKKVVYLLVVIILGFSLTGCSLLNFEKEPSIDLAEELLDDGEIDDAIDMLETLLDDDEEDYEAWQLLAEAYMEDEEYGDAADVLDDLAKVIIDNYDEDDKDIEDAMDTYEDLAKDIMDEDEDIVIKEIRVLLAEEGVIDGGVAVAEPGTVEPVEPAEPVQPVEPEPAEPVQPEQPTQPAILNLDTSVNGIQLMDDEYYYEYTAFGKLIVTVNMTADELDWNFEIAFIDSEESIRNQLETQFMSYDMGVEILECRKTDHTLFLSINMGDIDQVAYPSTVMEDVEYYYEGDYNQMVEIEPYYDYYYQTPLSAADLESIGFNSIVNVWGDGAYFQFPYDILATSGSDFNYISNNIIYITNGADFYLILDGSL